MKPNRSAAAMASALLLVAALGAPVAAQDATIEVVASGLNSPRGIALASDGSIYVAEAGAGGDMCLPDGGPCLGLTGSVARITDGTPTRVLSDLHSMAIGGVEIVGPSDVALIDDDTFYLIVNLGADPAERESAPEPNATQAGWLFQGSSDGTLTPVADVAAFESSDNPEPTLVDSNPHSVAINEGGVVVADAGGNTLLQVDDAGAVSLIAAFPPAIHEYSAEELAAMGPPPGEEAELPPTEGELPAPSGEAPPEGGMVPVPVETVPTSVVVGPDGALYMGQLTGGPFPVGGASVWRVVPGEEPTQYAKGFTNIIDIGFGPDDTLYVAEIVHAGLLGVFAGGQPAIGALLSVPPGGGDAQLILTGEQLMSPGGLAVAEDGSIYVSTGTLSPAGEGAVVKITP